MQRQYRLTNSRSFDYIYKRGKSVSNEYLALITQKSKFSSIRVGFVTGKKVGKSVIRNKVRRRMREAFRSLIKEAEGYTSYIFVARAAAAGAAFDVILQSEKSLMIKAGKLKV